MENRYYEWGYLSVKYSQFLINKCRIFYIQFQLHLYVILTYNKKHKNPLLFFTFNQIFVFYYYMFNNRRIYKNKIIIIIGGSCCISRILLFLFIMNI